jgi:hypothetical protein
MKNAKIEDRLFFSLVRLYGPSWKLESARFADKAVSVSHEIALAQGAAEQTLDFFIKLYIHRCLFSAQRLRIHVAACALKS